MSTPRCLAALALLGPASALAHPSGGPAVAWPDLPHRPGELADRSYRIAWTDTDFFTPTGTVAIDWFYTPTMPPTFGLGVTPPDLEGTPIVLGVDEEDRANAYVWDTSTVAPGAYWIWSRVHDLPGELSIRINAFSRGVVVVAHPGDPPVPAVAMITPKGPFELIDADRYDVVYEAFDPAGDGRVTLEAMQSRGGEDAVLIAGDLPAAASGTVSWSLAGVRAGDWILRATLVDGQGRRSVGYARFLLTVLERDRDASVPASDATPALDALPAYDGGVASARPKDEGCAAVDAGALGLWTALALALSAAARRGSGGSARR